MRGKRMVIVGKQGRGKNEERDKMEEVNDGEGNRTEMNLKGVKT